MQQGGVPTRHVLFCATNLSTHILRCSQCYFLFFIFQLTTIPPLRLNHELKVYDNDQTELRGSKTRRGGSSPLDLSFLAQCSEEGS